MPSRYSFPWRVLAAGWFLLLVVTLSYLARRWSDEHPFAFTSGCVYGPFPGTDNVAQRDAQWRQFVQRLTPTPESR